MPSGRLKGRGPWNLICLKKQFPALGKLRFNCAMPVVAAESEKSVMDRLSLSVFTLEVDRKPVLTFEARLYSEAEAIVADERLRSTLCAVKSGGVALCDDYSILRLRLAHPDEAKRFREAALPPTDDLKLVYLVDLDQPDEDTRARESAPSERLKAMRESASAERQATKE
jgi:hypothetical protein